MTDSQRGLTDQHGWLILTPELARVASETLDDVATPAESLGVVGGIDGDSATVSVGNQLADDYGDTVYRIDQLSVNPKTVDRWRARGYLA